MILKQSTIPNLLGGPVNIKWEEGAPLPVATSCHTAVLFNGAIYVGGGFCDNNNNMYRINIYHPDTNKWGHAIDTPHERFAMTILTDKLIIVGGVTKSPNEVTNKLVVLESGQLRDYTQMPTARCHASAVSHQSMMIVMGGVDSAEYVLSTTELLDSNTGQWFNCDDLPRPLDALESVIVGDTLYALGGIIKDDELSDALYAAPLDALSSHRIKWQKLADTPWKASAIVNLNNKYLLAVGGYAMHDTVCVLKREKGSMIISTSWECIGNLPNVHVFSSAVSLANKIIVIGGDGQQGTEGNSKAVTIGTFQ